MNAIHIYNDSFMNLVQSLCVNVKNKRLVDSCPLVWKWSEKSRQNYKVSKLIFTCEARLTWYIIGFLAACLSSKREFKQRCNLQHYWLTSSCKIITRTCSNQRSKKSDRKLAVYLKVLYLRSNAVNTLDNALANKTQRTSKTKQSIPSHFRLRGNIG